MRHVSRPATIRHNNIQVSGPPLTWENNGAPVRTGSDEYDSPSTPTRRTATNSSSSGSSSSPVSSTRYASSVTLKGDLPPLPPSPAGSRGQFDQSTVKKSPNLASGGYDNNYEDGYNESYPEDPADLISGKMNNVHIEDDGPDTTMLDSVILPAIASVSRCWFSRIHSLIPSFVKLFPRVSTQEARVALSSLQRAFTEAERIIPGVTLELVNEIVDSVEHVDD